MTRLSDDVKCLPDLIWIASLNNFVGKTIFIGYPYEVTLLIRFET